jgi:hypothetical protein
MPEFQGKQQTLAAFFGRASAAPAPPAHEDGHLAATPRALSVPPPLPPTAATAAAPTAGRPGKRAAPMMGAGAPPGKQARPSGMRPLASFFRPAPDATAAIAATATTAGAAAAENDATDGVAQPEALAATAAAAVGAASKEPTDRTMEDDDDAWIALVDPPETQTDAKARWKGCVARCTRLRRLCGRAPALIAARGGSGGRLLQSRPRMPLCTGHHEPCILLTVTKPGPNRGARRALSGQRQL